MKSTMPSSTQYFPSLIVSGLIAVLVVTQTAFTQTAFAQDAGTQAAQQAAQQANLTAMQNAQQANQQTLQGAQVANQVAAQQAAQESSSFPVQLGGINHPPAPQIPGGAVPARIASAHTILLTNVGISARLGLDTNQLYNDIHSRLQQWGYYQLVSSPQEADLVFQLDEIDPRNGENVTAGTDLYNRTPYFRIVVLDAKTSIALWTVTSPIYISGKKTYAHWMDVSQQNLITRLKALAQQPLSPAEQATLTEYPSHHGRAALILIPIAGVAAGSIAGVIAYHHAVNNAKASQDAFCQANNIPLSMCAGG